MKHIVVSAAVIKKGSKIFATQRGYGSYKDWWEFPGGKIEAGESPEQALVREIKEELGTCVSVGRKIDTVEYCYPEFHLAMHVFLCSVESGNLELLEHEDCRWLSKEDLGCVKWLPADELLLKKIAELI